MIKPQKVGHPAKLPDAPLKSCFYILNSNLYPTPEDYRAAFLINADVIDQTAPQFFPELRLFSGQILQLGDKVREYLLGMIYGCNIPKRSVPFRDVIT